MGNSHKEEPEQGQQLTEAGLDQLAGGRSLDEIRSGLNAVNKDLGKSAAGPTRGGHQPI